MGSASEIVIHTPNGVDVVAVQAPPTLSILGEDGAPLVTIHPNGTLEYGLDYTPDEAAQRFWDAMRQLAPARCRNCGHLPGHGVD